MTDTASSLTMSFRQAAESDLSELVRLRDAAAHWQIERGIDQWKPGELGRSHFRARLHDGEVWIATLGPEGPTAGAWELWWDDLAAWGEQPPVAGYVHRLMVDRMTAPSGAGLIMLAEAEQRIFAYGRAICRLDCLANNARLRRYYEDAGYTVVGEQPSKNGDGGKSYGVTLLEKHLGAV